jgi:rfaE bifunctional protein nucleotidyltransferase chain/domain
VIRVMANGCFDLLHAGHIAHLRAARAMGDFLIVSLTLDEYVGKGPGRPIYTWEDRAALLRELRSVDVVVQTKNAVDAIRKWSPDIFVKGVDYVNGGWTEDVIAACKEVGAELRFTSTPKMSASETIRKIMELDTETS